MVEMSLSNTQLEEIKKLAGLFYSPEEIAYIVDFDNVVQLRDDIRSMKGEASKAFLAGYRTAEVAFREKLIGTAMIGSSPAQTQVQKMIDKLDNNLMER